MRRKPLVTLHVYYCIGLLEYFQGNKALHYVTASQDDQDGVVGKVLKENQKCVGFSVINNGRMSHIPKILVSIEIICILIISYASVVIYNYISKIRIPSVVFTYSTPKEKPLINREMDLLYVARYYTLVAMLLECWE